MTTFGWQGSSRLGRLPNQTSPRDITIHTCAIFSFDLVVGTRKGRMSHMRSSENKREDFAPSLSWRTSGYSHIDFLKFSLHCMQAFMRLLLGLR